MRVMKKIAIVSLHFNPAYIGHMKAWYKMCEECNYEPCLFFCDEYAEFFEGESFRYIVSYRDLKNFKPNYAVVQNTGLENIRFFLWCDDFSCKIIYILHEPYMGIKELLKDGTYCVKQGIACFLNIWLCKKSARVLLCSDYAEKNCKKYMKNTYKKVIRFPLIFLDEYDEYNDSQRKYFSLIGNYAGSKGSDLFLNFIKYSFKHNLDINFQIATRSDISNLLGDTIFQDMIKKGQIIVQEGRDLSTDEINLAYKKSICCWNAYRRSTQSGVLANAFMQGTPVLASRLGSFEEYVVPNKTGEFINNEDNKSILEGYRYIQKNNSVMSKNCRCFFLEHFYYANQSSTFKHIIESIDK